MINIKLFYKKLLFIIFFLFINNFNKIYANDQFLIDKILAIVDDKVILKSDLNFVKKIEKLESNYFNISEYNTNKIILQQIITHNILKKIFNYKNYNIDNNDINKYLYKKSKNIFLDTNEFLDYVKFNNLNIDKYIKFIKNKIIFKKIIKDKIYPLISVSDIEINKYYLEIKNNKLLNELLTIYDFDLIKIVSNSKNYDDLYIKKLKELSLNLSNKKLNNLNNNNFLKKFCIENIYIKKFRNIQYKDLTNKLIYYFKKNVSNNDFCKNIIGPIFIKNFIYFIKIKSICTNNNINKLKLVNINYIFNIEKNTKFNKKSNFNYINKIYNNYINKNNLNYNKFNNINNINLGWKDINYYDSLIKKYILSTSVKSISKPFEYDDKWNLLYLNNLKYVNKEDYIKNIFLKEYILKNKSLYYINEIINRAKNNLYINILDKFYGLN